jgi:hypothetical protein
MAGAAEIVNGSWLREASELAAEIRSEMTDECLQLIGTVEPLP